MKVKKPGSIMNIATTDVVTLPPTTTIMAAAKTIKTYRFRRLPIADPGTRRIEGIITATDLINFFGGGDKHKIIIDRYSGNYLAAINEEVRSIMEKNVLSLSYTSDIEDGLDLMLKNGIGGFPIIDEEDRIVGIVTERDYLSYLANKCELEGKVSDYMTKGVITVNSDTEIDKAMKLMISKKIRRLPVIDDGLLIGWINTPMIVKYFSSEVFKSLITGNVKDALSQPVSVIISSNSTYTSPLIVTPDLTMSEVARRMLNRKVGCALVVKDERLEGIVTEKDMVKFLYKCKIR